MCLNFIFVIQGQFLEFPKLALKSLEFVIVNLSSINDVLKRVTTASRGVNIAHKMSHRAVMVEWASYRSAWGGCRAVILGFFVTKIALNSSLKQP